MKRNASSSSSSFDKRHVRRNRTGAALVELAIALPVLLILTLGLIEYGWVFYKVSQVNMAARAGVRVAVRPDATETQVRTAVNSMMSQSGIKTDAYTIAPSPMTLAVPVGTPLTVQVDVNYSKLSLTGTGFIPVPTKLQGKGTMAKEGPPPETP
jgi:Flp pilus assembly protein TadG